MKKILITGGAGFIGSTIASALVDDGSTPIILDDLSTGREEFLHGRPFYRGDIADGALVDRIFAEHPDIHAAVHCAAKIVVPESVAMPLYYYLENVSKTVALLDSLQRNECARVLFSSSASMYAPNTDGHVDEESSLGPVSPYARTKAMVEQILRDWSAIARSGVISLRYFNPIGADPKLRTGLQTLNPSHALGKLVEAHSRREPFTITGVEWPTRDGSAIRDYIHVWDLAAAHVAALRRFDEVLSADSDVRYRAINIGTGRGTTVRELVAAFEEAMGVALEVREGSPRPGDVMGCFTASHLARHLLGWVAEKTIADGVLDALAWHNRWSSRVARGSPIASR